MFFKNTLCLIQNKTIMLAHVFKTLFIVLSRCKTNGKSYSNKWSYFYENPLSFPSLFVLIFCLLLNLINTAGETGGMLLL